MASDIYKLNKTDKDIEQLIMQHKNLIYYMLANSGQLRNQDAESAAWEALWDAVSTFDVFSKTAFSTYACTLIKNAINDELRKSLAIKNQQYIFVDATEMAYLFCENDETQTMEIISRVYAVFDEYITKAAGTARRILLYWQSTGFDNSATNIANACGSNTSYVSRVQRGFRVYLSEKLKEQ